MAEPILVNKLFNYFAKGMVDSLENGYGDGEEFMPNLLKGTRLK